jgi:hypothetical protein
MTINLISLIFTHWASDFASGYDPTGRFQLRPNEAGEPEAFICCVIKGLQ